MTTAPGTVDANSRWRLRASGTTPRIVARSIISLSMIFLGTPVSGQSLKTGTSIVYIRSRDAFWIGADSHQLQLATGKKENACKIKHSKDMYFAVVGPENFGSVFDANAEARRAIAQTTSAKDARDAFVTQMTPRFERAIPAMLKEYPSFFKYLDKPNPKEAFSQAVFFEMMNGIIYAENAEFHLKLEKGRRRVFVVRNNCPGECPEPASITPLGRSAAFQPPFDMTKLPSDPVATIRMMIEMEMKAEPQDVGGNVNIFKLDATGGHWLTHNPECVGR